MSVASRAVLGVSLLLTAATVVGVHMKQKLDRERLREGVVRDLERQIRKEENLRLLEEQIVLTKYLEAEREKALEPKENLKFKQL
ncbi:protein PET117 homolog, mitochondrial [Rhinatrema bivittatum]|uniref:protein PET117 homolog, mitochondrial n=1 Tax=Rhinatrema bivittatum TaxID=194408 RepID=UPI00112EFA10|nr:protein PET117 homolog, mitochondrial [Rhinatrema bivittatum]